MDGQPDVEKECLVIKWYWWQSSMICKQVIAAVQKEKPAIALREK